MIDREKLKREVTRWCALQAIGGGRPGPVAEPLVAAALEMIPGVRCGERELREHLDYLETRGLITIVQRPDGGAWLLELTRGGIDLLDYVVECEPGIARPHRD